MAGRKTGGGKQSGRRSKKKAAAPAGAVPSSEADPMGLLRLVADLVSDRQLRMEFNRDRAAVVTDYCLDADAAHCLYTMSKAEVGMGLVDALADFSLKPGEFPVSDPDCLPEAGSGLAAYPDPDPTIFRLRLHKVPHKDLHELVVHGQSFPLDSEVELRRRGVTTIAVTGDVLGTYRCSKFRGAVSAKAKGSWDVFLIGNCGSRNPKQVVTVKAPYKLVVP